MLSTLGAAIAPGIALMSYFYLKDKYETEPLHMVIKSFILGMLIVFPVMLFQYVLQEEVQIGQILNSYLLVGFFEEFFKWLIIFYTAFRHIEFDEPYDGIVYTTAVSLGFATTENLFYLWSHSGMSTAFYRAILPVSSHGLFGVIMGYYFGRAKFPLNPAKTKVYLLISLLLPIFLHGTYDFILSIGGNSWIWLMIPFMILLWTTALDRSTEALKRSTTPSFGKQYNHEDSLKG